VVGVSVAKAVKAMMLDRRICLVLMVFFPSKSNAECAVSTAQVDNGTPQPLDDAGHCGASECVNYFTGRVALSVLKVLDRQ